MIHGDKDKYEEQHRRHHHRALEVSRGIQQIYYLNLEKNVQRRQQMEWHLAHVQPPVPYARVPALMGDGDDHDSVRNDPNHHPNLTTTTITTCPCDVSSQHPTTCRGVAGLTRTVLHLLERLQVRTTNQTTDADAGLALVLEDDYIVGHNLTMMNQAIQAVPADWDIIRFQCKGFNNFRQRQQKRQRPQRPQQPFLNITMIPNDHDWDIFETPRRRVRPQHNHNTNHRSDPSDDESFLLPPPPCGGTHAMVWRASSLSKLYHIWNRRPYQHIDCRLSEVEQDDNDNSDDNNNNNDNNNDNYSSGLKSYCVGRNRNQQRSHDHEFLGRLAPPKGESTDIPKLALS
ncbi:hypothetical protein ACA910_003210 [Epithemia clementina (nom. ined.)]